MANKIFVCCAFVALQLFIGCGRPSGNVSQASAPSPATSPGSVTATNLDARMNDDQILRVLGIDPTRASTRLIQGKDGTSTEYLSGSNQVTITRSLVSGVSVVKGTQFWQLGK